MSARSTKGMSWICNDIIFCSSLFYSAPGNFKDSWRLSEGFVAAEGKFLLRVRAVSRPDLVDCHLALLLSCFLQAGLLKVSAAFHAFQSSVSITRVVRRFECF